MSASQPEPVPAPGASARGASALGASAPGESALGVRGRDPLPGFFGGMAYVGRGLRMWVTSPRLMLLGAVPALLVGLVYSVAIVLFAMNLDGIAGWATSFAAEWSEPLRVGARFVVGAALAVGALLLAIYTFVAVTLAVGDPFYERIWRAVEERIGDAPPESDEKWWRSAGRALGDGVRLFALTATVGLAIALSGLIPLVGQVLAPVLGAILGGWFLAIELSGYAFEARRLRLRDRRRMLGARRATSLGFGVLTYLLFLIPGGAVVVMPAAVAGATMLSRDLLAARAPAAR